MIDVDRMVGGLGQLVQDADLASGDGCGREDRGAEQLLADRLRTGESEEEPPLLICASARALSRL